jgi:hypothetical protein
MNRFGKKTSCHDHSFKFLCRIRVQGSMRGPIVKDPAALEEKYAVDLGAGRGGPMLSPVGA